MTDYLQPLDLSVNKPIIDFLKGKFTEWFAYEVERLDTQADSELTDLLKSSVVLRDRHAGWLSDLVTHFAWPARRLIVRNGFKVAGLTDAVAQAVCIDPFIGNV